MVQGEPCAPFAFGFEIDHGLDHLGRRGVGRGRGAPRLAEDRLHLREGFDDLVLGLEKLGRLCHGNARQGHGHVHQRALVEVGHELAAEPRCGPEAQREHGQRDRDGGALEFERELDGRTVDPDQEPVHRVLVLRNDAAADEEGHQRRDQQDRQQRRGGHGEGLGVGERLEQPSLLRFQREDRQEGHGDDEQAEEERGADFDGGLHHDFMPLLAGRGAFQPLMRVLDHDDGGIHHRADGNSDAAEAHDVGAQSQGPHADIGDENAER